VASRKHGESRTLPIFKKALSLLGAFLFYFFK